MAYGARSAAGEGGDGGVVEGMREEEGLTGLATEAVEGGYRLVCRLAGAF